MLEDIENSLKTCRMDEAMQKAVQTASASVSERLKADPLPQIAEREIEKLKSREAALADKLLDGVFSDELFRQKQSEINDAVLLWKQRAQQAAEKTKLTDAVQAAIERLDSFHYTFQIANPERKREILQQLYSNRRVSGKNVYLEPQKWVQTVHDLASVSQCAEKITTSRIQDLVEFLNIQFKNH